MEVAENSQWAAATQFAVSVERMYCEYPGRKRRSSVHVEDAPEATIARSLENARTMQALPTPSVDASNAQGSCQACRESAQVPGCTPMPKSTHAVLQELPVAPRKKSAAAIAKGTLEPHICTLSAKLQHPSRKRSFTRARVRRALNLQSKSKADTGAVSKPPAEPTVMMTPGRACSSELRAGHLQLPQECMEERDKDMRKIRRRMDARDATADAFLRLNLSTSMR